jgi:hypothetical protein
LSYWQEGLPPSQLRIIVPRNTQTASTSRAKDYEEAQVTAVGTAISLTGTESAISDFGFRGGVASSATSYHPDGPYAVSKAEADSFYAGLASEPTLIYRTDVEEKCGPRPVDPRPSAD